MSTQRAPIPDNEFERVLKLSEYDIDYSEIKGSLNDLTKLAAHVSGTPISLINLLDHNTQWTVSNYGLDISQTKREDTACQYVILDDNPLEVTDMSQDERFMDNEYVTSDPNIKYYFGIPLTTTDGHNIGAMCVMDTTENSLDPEKEELLKIITKEVITRIESEYKLRQLRLNLNELKEVQRKVSHDIRGPISGIIGMAGVLKDEAEERELEDLLEMIELIDNGGRSVLELADEILGNKKENTQNDNEQLSNDELTLPLLKQKLDHLYKPQAINKSIDYSISLDDENQDFPFPKHKLLQILGNLICNAIKFTPEKGSVEVFLKLQKPDIALIATIKDTGVGMTKEQIEALKAGSGKSTKGTTQEHGFGFGFKLAKHLTESLDGTINIESEEGKGSNITTTIPLD